jgi:FkbM family methyltransferase
MDEHAPRVMGVARYRLHVSLRGDVVYPKVTKVLFARIGAREGSAIDVGANVGIFSRYLAANFRQVAAVEPVPYLAERLRRSLPAQCRVDAVALGDSQGTVVLRIPVDAQGREMHALTTAAQENVLEFVDSTGFVEHQVPMQRLDDIAAGMPNLGYIKIDVEGFERAVLAGATRILDKQRPVIQLEIARAHNPRYAEVLSLFADKSYYAYALTNDGLREGAEHFIAAQPMSLASQGASALWDFLFVPQERDAQLTAGLVLQATN